jgi:hypothetical protein
MFGYVRVQAGSLPEAARGRYQAYYCGLCRALKARHGQLSRLTLSFDLTFVYILLCALYEPELTDGQARCPAHPLKPRPFRLADPAGYVADMNALLFYHKARDNWADERSIPARLGMAALEKAVARIRAAYPAKCAVIEGCLQEINALEKADLRAVDTPANLTGRLLGEVFIWKEDFFSPALRAMGEALGRFIYTMDAWEDLPDDLRRGRYNPLTALKDAPDYDELMDDALRLMMGECAAAFEALPLTDETDILRNVLYAGVWQQYSLIRAKRNDKGGRKAD